MNEYLIAGIGLGLGIVFLVGKQLYINKADRKRVVAIKKIASQINMTYYETDEDLILFKKLHRKFRTLSRNTGLYMSNILERKLPSGLIILLFDYEIKKGKYTYKQSVICFTVNYIAFPEFILRPETFSDNLSNVFKMKDIDFEENKLFSSQSYLKGPDEEAIRKLFTTETLSHFAKHPGWIVEAQGSSILLFKERRLHQPEDLPSFLQKALDILHVLGVREREFN